jgi:hypothetical protein
VTYQRFPGGDSREWRVNGTKVSLDLRRTYRPRRFPRARRRDGSARREGQSKSFFETRYAPNLLRRRRRYLANPPATRALALRVPRASRSDRARGRRDREKFVGRSRASSARALEP